MSEQFVTFGEIMLRYSPPGRELLLQTPRLEAWVAGAEANVAVALARLGHAATMVSAVPANALGDAAIVHLRGHGVDTGHIARSPGRMGVYYVATGSGMRATDVIYDRAGSSFATAPDATWDWSAILAGAGHFHLSGITPALGPQGTGHALAAARAASDAGVRLSFDGNYRATLWNQWDGRPRETLNALVGHATMLFGNHRDIALLLGEDFADTPDRARTACEAAFAAFPRLELIASTRRDVKTVDEHLVGARIDSRTDAYETQAVAVAGIVDRIGTGDAFAAGVLHGLASEPYNLERGARDGLAMTVLKHSMPGDACLIRPSDLDLFHAGSLDVRR